MNPYRAPAAIPARRPEPLPLRRYAKWALYVLVLPLIVLGRIVVGVFEIMIEVRRSQDIAFGFTPRPRRPYVPPPERDESLPPWERYKNDRSRRWDGYGA